MNPSHQCAVCEASIDQPAPQTNSEPKYRFCSEFACQSVAKRQSQLSPESFRQLIANEAKIAAERKQFIKEAAEKREVEQALETAEDRKVWQAIIAERPELEESNCDLIAIPNGEKRIAPVEPDRIAQFRAYAQELIEKASQFDSFDAIPKNLLRRNRVQETKERLEPNPSLTVISNQLCAQCRGGCCASGGDHAHLCIGTMRQFMDQHPDKSQTEILETYLSYIPEIGVFESCILQSETGCSLPRELRSDVCNGYFCEPLVEWQEKSRDLGERTVVSIQRKHHDWWAGYKDGESNEIVEVTLIKHNGSESIPPPETES